MASVSDTPPMSQMTGEKGQGGESLRVLRRDPLHRHTAPAPSVLVPGDGAHDSEPVEDCTSVDES